MNGVSISTTIFGPKGMAVAPIEEALDRIAEAGYRHIEISRKHLKPGLTAETVARRGLKVWSAHGTMGGGAVSADEGKRRETVDREIELMELAAAFAPCPYVVHYLNRYNDDAPGAAFRRSVEELLRRAEGLGLSLAVETVPDKVENERFPPSREVVEFVRSLKSPNASVCLDVNHSNIGEDIFVVCRNCAGLVSNIHVSDNWGAMEDHLPPGQGSIPLAAVMQAVADGGYRGPLNMECHVPGYPSREVLTQMREWAEKTVVGLKTAGRGAAEG